MTKIADFLKAGVHVKILYFLCQCMTIDFLDWPIFMPFSTT